MHLAPLINSLSLSLSLTSTQARTHACTHALLHKHTCTPTRMRTRAHDCTRTCTSTHVCADTHMHTREGVACTPHAYTKICLEQHLFDAPAGCSQSLEQSVCCQPYVFRRCLAQLHQHPLLAEELVDRRATPHLVSHSYSDRLVVVLQNIPSQHKP